MAATKEDLQRETRDNYARAMNEIDQMTGGLESDGYSYEAAVGARPYLFKCIKESDIGGELNRLRLLLGAYKIDTYWVVTGRHVGVAYWFGVTRVVYLVDTSNADEFIEKISGGKCRIQVDPSPRVVCDI